MKCIILFFLSIILFVEAIEKSDGEVEARGKGKFALLTNLAILLAAKVGLFKICLGIALVLGTIKLGVFMAWALAIFKYVPDPYIFYKTVDYKPKYNYVPFHENHDYAHGDGYGHNVDIHFFYVVATKLFVLKVVYGIIFYVLVSKAWHFGLWFIHYLKEKKHEHYDYIDHDPYHGHYDHGHYDHYGPSHQPYIYEKHGYDGKGAYDSFDASSYSNNQDTAGSYSNYYKKYATSHSSKKHNKGVYDSDGSYSVKS